MAYPLIKVGNRINVYAMLLTVLHCILDIYLCAQCCKQTNKVLHFSCVRKYIVLLTFQK